MYTSDDAIRDASSAEPDALWRAIKAQHPQALSVAAQNRSLTEDMAVFIAKSRHAPKEVLGLLASDVRFKGSYKIITALCKNPLSPQRVTLTLLKFLHLFDLADLSRNRFIPSVIRQRVELMLMERIPGMASGVKIALSRRASTPVIIRLMERSDRKVAETCLESPRLTEELVFRIIQRPVTPASLIRAIAGHPKWSLRYQIRYALIRNFHTPLEFIERFIEGMKTADLRDLYIDHSVSASTRPFIYRELMRRGEPVEHPLEETHEIDEDEGLSEEEAIRLGESCGSPKGGPEEEEEDEEDDTSGEGRPQREGDGEGLPDLSGLSDGTGSESSG